MAYNTKVVKKVLSDFDNKYKAAITNAEKRKKDLYDKIPELYEIDMKLSNTYKELAGVILGSGVDFNSKVGEVRQKNPRI